MTTADSSDQLGWAVHGRADRRVVDKALVDAATLPDASLPGRFRDPMARHTRRTVTVGTQLGLPVASRQRPVYYGYG